MMNVIDFVRESATFMAKDRPDVYDEAGAARELAQAMEILRESDLTYACVTFTSYMLARIMDDGVEEFLLTRKLASVLVCEEEQSCLVFGYTDALSLPSVSDPQDPLDEDDDSW